MKPGEEGVPTLTSSELAEFENNPLVNQVDFIWSTQTVAAGDTAVLHCSFDAIFQQLRNGMVSAFILLLKFSCRRVTEQLYSVHQNRKGNISIIFIITNKLLF